MRILVTIVMAGLIAVPAFTQVETVNEVQEEPVIVSEDQPATVVSVGENETVVVDENKDTTRIKVGNKGIIIIEGDKGTQVNIENIDENSEESENFSELNDEDVDNEDIESKAKFKPHWEGIEIGLNNYVNSNGSMSLDPIMSFMDLNTSRSWNFNVNFLQYGFGLGTDKIGLVTGLGFEWNNYHFDNDNNIQKVDGVIESFPLSPATYPNIQKTKLQTTYLRAPLLVEFQIPAGSKRIYLSAGPIAGVKLGANTKIVYKENGDIQKVKDKDDYNLSSIRYGFTARAGYRGLKLFANYYLTPLFETNKGPELYPFSVGLTLADF
jgi:hypothetical protein